MPDGIRAVLLGAPGSGKGTQAERLAAALDIPAVSTGDLLRRAVAAGTDLGKRVQGVMAAGQLVEDSLMADVIRERLDAQDAANGFLLDGFPRTTVQAEMLEGLLAGRGQSLDAVVFLEVPDEALVRRALARRRADDREAVIRERLRIFRLSTEPLVEYFERRGLLHRIDGSQSIEQVTSSILDSIAGDN